MRNGQFSHLDTITNGWFGYLSKLSNGRYSNLCTIVKYLVYEQWQMDNSVIQLQRKMDVSFNKIQGQKDIT